MKYLPITIFILLFSSLAFSQKANIQIPNNSVSLSIGFYRDFPRDDNKSADSELLYFDLGLKYSYRSGITPIGFCLGLDFHSIDNLGGIVDFTVMPNLHFDLWKNHVSLYFGAGGLLARASSSNWKTYLWGYALSLDAKYNIDKSISAGIELKHHQYIRDIKSVPFIANVSFSLNF
jgi:hypothetical protein